MSFSVEWFPALMISVGAIGTVLSSIAVAVLTLGRNRE